MDFVVNYNEQLSHFMENPQRPQTRRCVLYIRFPKDVLFGSKNQDSLFSSIHAKQAQYIIFLEDHTKEILRHQTGLIAFFEDANTALLIALQLMSQYLCISLVIGDGWLVEDEVWIGVARWKSERISFFVPVNQLWMSKESLDHVQLPDGIGFFDGNNHQTQTLGFPYCEIKDYRVI